MTPPRQKAKRWVVFDRHGGKVQGHFQLREPMSGSAVERAARSLLPELSDPYLLPWDQVTRQLLREALAFRPFTPEICARLGVTLAEPPAGPSVRSMASALQQRFARVKAGGAL
jgi:hypothetical protein